MVTAGAQETEAGLQVHSILGAWGGGAAALGVVSTIMAPVVVRWYTTSHSVLPTLSRGLFVLRGW